MFRFYLRHLVQNWKDRNPQVIHARTAPQFDVNFEDLLLLGIAMCYGVAYQSREKKFNFWSTVGRRVRRRTQILNGPCSGASKPMFATNLLV